MQRAGVDELGTYSHLPFATSGTGHLMLAYRSVRSASSSSDAELCAQITSATKLTERLEKLQVHTHM